MSYHQCMFALAFLIILIAAIPNAFGQTTNIIFVSYPPKTSGIVNVIAKVSYSGGDWLVAALVQLPPPVKPVNSDVNATPISCTTSKQGLCAILTNGRSGVEMFRWSFLVVVPYPANVTYGVESFVNNSTFVEYKDSYNHQQFSILVTPTTNFTVTSQIQMTTQTYSTSEVPASAPLVAAAMLVALIVVYLQPRRTHVTAS